MGLKLILDELGINLPALVSVLVRLDPLHGVHLVPIVEELLELALGENNASVELLPFLPLLDPGLPKSCLDVRRAVIVTEVLKAVLGTYRLLGGLLLLEALRDELEGIQLVHGHGIDPH